MFVPSPLQVKAALVAGAAMAIALLALTVWGLYWRGEYRECKAVNVVLAGQVKVLADKLDTQSAAILSTAAAGRQAVEQGRELLAQARRAGAAAERAAQASDAIARGAAQPGKDCNTAWQEIEMAGASPSQPPAAAPGEPIGSPPAPISPAAPPSPATPGRPR